MIPNTKGRFHFTRPLNWAMLLPVPLPQRLEALLEAPPGPQDGQDALPSPTALPPTYRILHQRHATRGLGLQHDGAGKSQPSAALAPERYQTVQCAACSVASWALARGLPAQVWGELADEASMRVVEAIVGRAGMSRIAWYRRGKHDPGWML